MGAARIFQIATPYLASELADLDYEQTADLVILTHLNHPPQVLRRYGHASWTMQNAAFLSLAAIPAGVGAVATVATAGTAIAHKYVVTNIDATTGQESLPSASASCNNDLEVDVNNHNTVSWTAATNSGGYNIYESKNGLYGFVGAAGASATSFKDNNIAADLSDGPPGSVNPFTSADNYPARVTFHEQRAVFGRTNAKPSTVIGSQSGDFFNMNKAVPAKDSDSYNLTLVARQVNAIQHLVPAKVLLIFTSEAVWSLQPTTTGGVISPNSARFVPESYRGSSAVRPAPVDDIVFYNTAKGAQIRTVGYQFAVDGYRGNDVTVFAPHFFAGHTIVQMAWTASPTSVLWCVRDDGVLLSLTWQAEQEVWGWSMQTTDGLFEDVVVVTEGGEDVPYFVVRRTVGGVVKRYIERLGSPFWGTDAADANFLDCSLSYDGAATNTLRGLGHLEGETVTALGDGAVYEGLVVTDGAISFPDGRTVAKAHVGLPYEAWVHTLPIVAQTSGGSSASANQTLGQIMALVKQTRGLEAAMGRVISPLDDDTSDASAAGAFYPIGPTPPINPANPEPLYTGRLVFDPAPGDWDEATLILRSRQPLPFTLLGVFPDVEVGG